MSLLKNDSKKNTKEKDIYMFSIDSSTKKTGITIWKNAICQEIILLNYDNPKQYPTMNDRYPIMCSVLQKLLNQYKPQIIYIEDEVVKRNMATCRFLFRLQGTIEGWCLINNCEFNTIRPTEWRKACSMKQGKKIKRDDLKQQSIDYVKNLLDLNVTDDQADSVCIGIAALKRFNIPVKTAKSIKILEINSLDLPDFLERTA